MPVSLSSCVVMNCNSLRKLSLSFVTLDESILQTLLNSCPLIVSFILKFCSGLEKIELRNLQKIKSVFIRICKNQRVKIEAPTLEVSYFGLLKGLDVTEYDLSDVWERFNTCKSQSLKIRNCDGIKEIDATNLISIEYQGKQTPELKIARESCHQKHSKIVLSCFRLDAALFGKLRKFLSNSASWSQVSLYLHDCTKINMNDLLLHDRVSIPQVDVLDLKIESYQECPAFVDVLLLSCHPRRVNLSSYVKINKCFIDRVMYSSHSTSHGRESWHSQLIGIKAFDVNNQPLQLRSEEWDTGALRERKKLYFLLDCTPVFVEDILGFETDASETGMGVVPSQVVHFFRVVILGELSLDQSTIACFMDRLMYLVLTPGSHQLPIFTILAAKSLRELFLEYCNLMPVSLSSGVVNCNSLRKLSLLNVKLDENKLKTLLNSCPVIVSLILRSERFSTLKSRSLKILKLRAFFGIMEIDAPNLVSIEYEGCQIPELKFARESIKPKHSKILLSLDNDVNATWFGKLRKFLSNSISWSQVSIKCNTIKMNDWQPDRRVAAPQVDVLNLNIRSFRDCPALWRLFY
ncbi:putative F-box protein-like [Capsicum annuum]|nr:putative F-box protein-like [Capsicum annuum]